MASTLQRLTCLGFVLLLTSGCRAASPLRISETFTYTGDVGFGNGVFVSGNHPDVGNWNPTNAVKLRWTAGNVWTGRIGIQAGTELQYKFIRRSTDRSQICNSANATDLTGVLTRDLPSQPAAPYPGKTILYHSPGELAYIHYRAGSNWVSAEMTRIGAGRTAGENLFRLTGIGEAGEWLEFVPHNGAGQWDNPVGGGNYLTALDVVFLQDKQVFNYPPPSVVSAPVLQMATVNSSVVGIPGRTVRVYLPRGYAQNADQRYPVMYLHDGQNVFDPGGPFGSWSADATATREIGQGRMRECILVGIDNTPNRIPEYMPPTDSYQGTPGVGDKYLNYVLQNVQPYVNSTYRTLTNPANTLTGGSSLGGLISLYFGRESTNFASIAVVSPAFWIAPNYLNQVRAGVKKPARVYLDMGTAETAGAWNDYLGFHDTLLAQGYALNDDALSVVGCGDQHNEAAWKKRLPVLFRFLLNPWEEPNRLAAREFPPRLTLIGWNSESATAALRFPTLRGYQHELQRSSNLLHWVQVKTVPAELLPWAGRELETDWAANVPQAYWRLQATAQP